MKLKTILFISFIVTAIHVYADPGRSIRVNIVVTDHDLYNKTLQVDYYNFYSLYGTWPVTKKQVIKLAKEIVVVEIENASQFGTISFLFPEPYFLKFPYKAIVAEAGDCIEIEMGHGMIKLKGKDGPSYQIQRVLNEMIPKSPKGRQEFKLTNISVNLRYYDDFMNSKLNILRTNKDAFNSETFKLLELNIISQANLMKLDYFRYFLREVDSADRQEAFNYVRELCNVMSNLRYDSLLLENSSYYFDFWYLKEAVEVENILHYQPGKENLKFHVFFNNLTNQYSGKLRDKLLLSAVVGDVSFRDSTDLYRDKALNLINDSAVRSILIKQISKIGPGAPAYPFELPDSAGRIIRLSDFRGKIVIVDFYFTGCKGCVALASSMSPIIEKYMANSSIVFVSVNIDKTMGMFKEAIKSGKYTHKASVNVFTNGMGANSEITEYYGIIGCPFLMIIDRNGRMYDSNPPYPGFGAGSTEKFEMIVETALMK